MIDETVLIKKYLGGDYSKQNLYNVYYLLIRHYNEQGFQPPEIRHKLFDWANSHGLFVKYNVNLMITKAIEENRPLSKGKEIRISDDDFARIKDLFDLKKTRLTALAVLCCAKAYANENGEFVLSSCDLGAWLDIYNTNLRNRYLAELCLFGYISKVEIPKNNSKWVKTEIDKSTKYKINVPFVNEGNHILVDNNILGLYNEFFGKIA